MTGFNDECLNTEGVVFTGKISDDELLKEISSAGVLVQPSEYEGFGIPPLEALYLNTKPIVSDIEVFKEVYEDLDVDFFKVNDIEDLANKIIIAEREIKDSRAIITQKYSYEKTVANLIKKAKEVLREGQYGHRRKTEHKTR